MNFMKNDIREREGVEKQKMTNMPWQARRLGGQPSSIRSPFLETARWPNFYLNEKRRFVNTVIWRHILQNRDKIFYILQCCVQILAFFNMMILYSNMSSDLSILPQGVRGPACRSRHTGKKTNKQIKQKIDFDTHVTLLDMGQISIPCGCDIKK